MPSVLTPTIVSWNAVVAAGHFNPSILTQLWLVKNGIVAETEFVVGSGNVFTDALVQFQTDSYLLLALPDQVQMTPQVPPNACGPLVAERLGKLVSALPHTPYKAVGINFRWQLDPNEEPLGPIARRLFSGRSTLYDGFAGADAAFGAYLSRDFGSMRLRLDIKPITKTVKSGPTERLQLSFNFQRNLSGEQRVDKICESLAMWNVFFSASEETVRSVVQDAANG